LYIETDNEPKKLFPENTFPAISKAENRKTKYYFPYIGVIFNPLDSE
jgi:hypothetical protein